MSILIFEGMKSGIQDGDFIISCDEDGNVDSNLILSTSYNILPIWLKIAYENLVTSHEASKEIGNKWSEDNAIQKELLLAELTPSIQVFVACGCAIDALYDQLKEYSNISENDIKKWKEKKTSRSSQIVEIIRRSYKLDNELVKAIKNNIKSIMEFRDKVVHPSNKIERTCTRPDIPVGVDWKFSAYRYSNSAAAYTMTMNLLVLLYDKKTSDQKANENMENIFKALIEMNLVSKNG